MTSFSRRSMLIGSAALLAAPAIRHAHGAATFGADPFTLGIASGYPLPGSVVLWTRLAPEPLAPGGGMPPTVVPVEWEIARDERMDHVVRRGRVWATPDWAHSVHVEPFGLEPGRWYWYRFRAGDAESPIGRTRTAPAANTVPERMRFAFASCQHYEQGYFSAYRHMREDEPDLVLHLGDYIYESSWGRDHVRRHGAPEPYTLDDYRARLALYKTDPDLQAMHAACPWLVTSDDHEVDNDYADDRSEQLDPRDWFLLRRAAAYKAYYEHMPLRRGMVPMGPHLKLYERSAFGGLVEFLMLDDRQYRSHQVCPRPARGGSAMVDCEARLDPSLTLLGATQERWLEAALDRSQARWNVVAQQTLMAQLDRKPGEGKLFWTDGWDGYPAARRRFLDFLERRKPSNPVVIGGDVHSFFVADLKPDFDDPRSPTVASEFCGTSITSQLNRPQSEYDAIRAENPHVKVADLRHRGYVRVEATPARMTVDLRSMKSVTDPDADCDTLATFVVEDGRPGPVAG